MGLFDKNKKKSETVTAAPASTFATRMTEKKANASAGDWAKTSSALLSEIERNDGTWQSADAYHDLNTRLNTLLASAGKWRAAYASDQKATAQINDVVSALTRAQEYENEQRKYWSQWDSAETYDGYLKAQEAEAARWRELSGNYDAVRDAQTAQEGLTAFDTVLRERAAATQAKEEAEQKKPWWQSGMEAFATGQRETTMPSTLISDSYYAYRDDTSYREPDERWTEEMRHVFGYLYHTDPEKAYTYATEVNNRLNAGEKAGKLERISAAATKNFGAGVAHTLGSLITAPLGLADYLSNLTEHAARGTITQDKFVTPFDYSRQASGAISEKLNEISGTIDEDVFVLGGKGLGDVYSLGHSAAQSLLSAYTLGGTGTLIAYIGMGGASGVDDALARGATPEQALLYGTLVGSFEGLTEQIGADRLLKITSASTLKRYLLDILKNGLGESVEEGASSIAGAIADGWILRDKSVFATAVAEYMAQGMDRKQAQAKALADTVGDVIYGVLGGFVTGGANAALTGGVKTALGKYAEHAAGNGETAQREAATDSPTIQNETPPADASAGKPTVEEYTELLKAAQTAQEDDSHTGEQLVTEAENEAQAPQTPATEADMATGEDNTAPKKGIDPDVAEMFYSDPAEAAQEMQTETDTQETTADTDELTLEEASKAYGAQAGAMLHTYLSGQDVADYDRAYRAAFDMGRAGVSLPYAMNSTLTSYLKDGQRELAYRAGLAAADMAATEAAQRNTDAANGKIGRRRGVVKSEGVTLDELRSAFNDTQRTAYKLLSTLAEVTGIDIVLYRSESDSEAQGKFEPDENTVYIDVNAGLRAGSSTKDFARYTMMRTFSHEFTHFLEKWNPVRYNEFRRLVFDTMTEHGHDVDALIEHKMAQDSDGTMTAHGEDADALIEHKMAQDSDGKMTYEEASREVVAEAMTDILPETDFVRTLAERHRTVFDKLLEKLKEFVADMAAHFRNFGTRQTPEARALKEQIDGALRYTQDIVKMFDEIALEAVESYQRTVAVDEAAADVTAQTVGDGFTVTENEQFGSLEISFTEKPSEAVRAVLKEHKFRWNKNKHVWYGYAESAEISDAIRGAENPNHEHAAVDNKTAASDNNNAAVDHDRGKDEHNAEQRENRETEASRGEEETAAGRHPGTQTETGDGRGVSEEVGESSSDSGHSSALWKRYQQLSLHPKFYAEDAYVSPRSDSVEEAECHILSEYGIESYVVQKTFWDRDPPAHTEAGRVYMIEDLPEKNRGAVAYHEITHIMDALQYKPYLDFVERIPDMMDTSTFNAQVIIESAAEHCHIDLFDLNDFTLHKIYDEVSATVYGGYTSGKLTGEARALYQGAFYDLDAYLTELSTIHEQFKRDLIAANRTEKTKTSVTAADSAKDTGDAFSIVRNPQYGSLEILFKEKPPEAVRAVLKEHKFRWHSQKGIWFGQADRTKLAAAMREAYANATDTNVGDTNTERVQEQSRAYLDHVTPDSHENMSEEDRAAGTAIADFIMSVSNMLDRSKISKRKLKIGTVSDAHAEMIKTLLKKVGVDFSANGYELWIDGTCADHIHRRHGEHGQADHSMALRETQELIPWVANHPDSGELIRDDNGSIRVSHRYKNADGSQAYQIRLHKKINGDTVYVAECVPDGSAKRIYITSAYIKKGSTNQVLNLNSNEIRQPTPEAVFDSGATKGSIARSGDFVNTPSNTKQEQEQVRTDDAPTDRELLAMAADAIDADRMIGGEFVPVDLSEGERDALRIFREKLDQLEEIQLEREKLEPLKMKRERLNQRYLELQFGTNNTIVDRAAAEKIRAQIKELDQQILNGNDGMDEETLNRMKIYDDQIRRATNDLLDLQNKDVLRRILERAREIVESRERAKAKETLQKWRAAREDTYLRQTYQRAIRREVKQLTNWTLDDHNKDAMRHVPAVLREAVVPFLRSIDLSSSRQLRGGEATAADKEFNAGLAKLSQLVIGHNEADSIYSVYGDLPPAFYQTVNELVSDTLKLTQDNTGEYIVYRMSAEQLKTLLDVVRTLKKAITDFNEFHVNTMYRHVSEAAENTITTLQKHGSDNGRTGGVDNFLFFRTMRPGYVFERFGEGGRAIYKALQQGQAQLTRDAKQILDFAEKTYTAEEVQTWGKETHTVRLSSGTVRLTTAEIMSFYELAKRPQALQHILGEGIRPSVKKVLKDGAKVKKEKRDDSGHRMTEEDIAALCAVLTPRQRKVADALQEFMQEVGGAWGNYVSIRRFGVKQFGDPHYFPIHSDGRYIDFNGGDKPAAASLYALLNMGFTKQLNEKATDKIVLYDIFDVFANHMASMAQYHAMALPVSDAMKWFNYAREEKESGRRKETLRDELKRVFGRPEESGGSRMPGYAESFITGVLRAFNGTETQSSSDDSLALKLLHNYNRAQVAFNLRVMIQQPFSIMRAGTVIDYKSIVKGLHADPRNIARDIREMREHSGIAAWKALGFYDTNISRGMTDMIKHRITPTEKLTEYGLKGAELADSVTWAAIWSACKKEVGKKQKLTAKDAGYFEAVTELFEDVIYKTQVVDSVLTKNEYMRSKGFVPRTLSSFMGEPMTTANVVLNEIDGFARERREIGFKKTWKKRGKQFTRVMCVYTISQVLNAAGTAIMDAWRDDDDYETFLEKYREAFLGIEGNAERWWEVILGLLDSNLASELMLHEKLPIVADASDAVKSILAPFLNHLGANIFSSSRQTTIGQITGYLTSMAEIAADKIFGEDTNYTDYAVIYKLFQGFSGMSGIPLAAVTREAISAWNNTVGAMAPSLKVRSYDPGDAASIRYAYRDGYLTAEEAIDELAAHGQTANEIRSQIGTWYRGREITKSQAVRMLQKHGDMTEDEITLKVNKWSCVVVTGIKYEEIDDEYLAGKISRRRAIEMYTLYGGMDRTAAVKKVDKLNK